MAVLLLGCAILTLAIASKEAVWSSLAGQLWRAVMSWETGLGAHMVLWKHPIVKSELHTRALLGSRDSVPLRLKKKAPRPC